VYVQIDSIKKKLMDTVDRKPEELPEAKPNQGKSRGMSFAYLCLRFLQVMRACKMASPRHITI
jgi:hypothetical protein